MAWTWAPGLRNAAAPARRIQRGSRGSRRDRAPRAPSARRMTARPSSAWLLHHGAAAAAGAVGYRGEEALEDRRQLRFDIRDFGEFLVKLGAAVLAVPLKAVAFAGPPGSLDHQPDGIGRTTRGVRQVRGQ